jgi:hypothetical protein
LVIVDRPEMPACLACSYSSCFVPPLLECLAQLFELAGRGRLFQRGQDLALLFLDVVLHRVDELAQHGVEVGAFDGRLDSGELLLGLAVFLDPVVHLICLPRVLAGERRVDVFLLGDAVCLQPCFHLRHQLCPVTLAGLQPVEQCLEHPVVVGYRGYRVHH